MGMNLITSAWLPVRRRSGRRDWITPGQITEGSADDPIVALDFPRPDWNAAITEFLIGLVTAAYAPRDAEDWAALWQEPPEPLALTAALSFLAFAFEVEGDGPCAFQDYDLLAESKERKVRQLLIDAPGANTLKKNIDLFIKRTSTPILCLPYAMAALITLQCYAPQGGQGHLTSLRGGGPLTTLIRPVPQPVLWQTVWANVPLYRDDDTDHRPPRDWSAEDRRWPRIFPWLAPTLDSTNNREVGPGDGHPTLLPFFACPRRIRLSVEPAGTGPCSLRGETYWGLVSRYHTETDGASYTNWTHPLSPYGSNDDGEPFARRPNDATRTYQGWTGVWGGEKNSRPAQVVALWPERADEAKLAARVEIDAFGYWAEQAAVSAWIEARVPLLPVTEELKGILLRNAELLINGAGAAARSLDHTTRLMRTGEFRRDREGPVRFRVPKTAKPKLASDVTAVFWAETQGAFVETLTNLVTGNVEDPAQQIRAAWRDTLRKQTLDLFERLAAEPLMATGSADVMKRYAHAQQALWLAFEAKGSVTKAMEITIDAAPRKAGKAKRGAT